MAGWISLWTHPALDPTDPVMYGDVEGDSRVVIRESTRGSPCSCSMTKGGLVPLGTRHPRTERSQEGSDERATEPDVQGREMATMRRWLTAFRNGVPGT
jgi:hypothetical protein